MHHFLLGFRFYEFDLNGDGCDGKTCGACGLDCASYDDENGRLFERERNEQGAF